MGGGTGTGASPPDAPHVATLAEWLGPRHRKVAILAADRNRATQWAASHELPQGRWVHVHGPQQLYGMYGDDWCIVRLQGASTGVRKTAALSTALAVCAAAQVWILNAGIADDETEPAIGGAEVFSDGAWVHEREEGQGDTFRIVDSYGREVEITREGLPALLDLLQAWQDARPFTDPAAVHAEAIRQAATASNDPFARPDEE